MYSKPKTADSPSTALTLLLVVMSVAATLYMSWAGLARFSTVHNETFDLAMYARMSWGFGHLSLWDPVVGATILGLHLSFVQLLAVPFGEIFGYAESLIVLQAACIAAAVFPLARIAKRRLGAGPAFMAAMSWLVFPNIGHVSAFEYHPGTCAVLPLAWAFDALDREHAKHFLFATVAVLACREDLALMTFFLALATRSTSVWPLGKKVMIASTVYFLFFVLVLIPIFGPETGSVSLHFGKWGGSLIGVVQAVFTSPAEVLSHVFAPERLLYLGRLFGLFLFLPLIACRHSLVALPFVAINLLSEWPTTIELDSHYQTTLLVPLFVATIIACGKLARGRAAPAYALAAALLFVVAYGHSQWGGTPLSADWTPENFEPDARTAAAKEVLARVPDGESVQAPYPLMPHLAEREFVRKRPPPDYNTDYLILDAWHRDKHWASEDLLRTDEEPVFRHWLGRDDYGIEHIAWPFILLRRNASTRTGFGARYLAGTVFPDDGVRVAKCLNFRGVRLLDEQYLQLEFGVTEACPKDLAIRLGAEWSPNRVDLLFDGLLSPHHLRRGDRVLSVHRLNQEERAELVERGLRLGAIRESGARPEHADPVSIRISVWANPGQSPKAGTVPGAVEPSAVPNAP